MSTEQSKEKATRAVAEMMWDHNATRAMGPMSEAPSELQRLLLEGALGIVNKVWEVGAPVAPDVEVLKMRIKMLADEVGGTRRVGGQEMREALLDLLVDL